MEITRRNFVRGLGGSSLAAWLGVETALDVGATEQDRAPDSTRRGILKVEMQTSRLDEMATFYGKTMGWPTERASGKLRVQAGGSELIFTPAAEGEEPVYHLAWAIPSNKTGLGKAWLAQRTPILVHPDGRDEFHFRYVQRRAVYFADPAGNILEIIAREKLGDVGEGPFGLADLKYVNHVGLVVDDMHASTMSLLRGLDLRPTQRPTPQFATLGDAHRHVVLVTRGRLWLPEMTRPADVFATDILMHGEAGRELSFDELPYRIAMSG